jgi:hypothetical protein
MTFRPGLGLFWQVLRWSVVVFGFALMIRSGSRGPLFAVMVASLAFLPLSRRVRDVGQFFAVGGTAVLILAIAAWAFDQYATSGRWNPATIATEGFGVRYGTSAAVLTSWIDRGPMVWLFGYGNSGSFSREVNNFYPEVVPIELLGEEGVVGLVLWLAIVGISLAQITRVYRLVRPYAYERGIFSALAAIYVFELLLTLKGGSLLTNTSCFIFAIILSRYGAYVTREVQASEQDRLMQPVEEEQQLVPAYGYWPAGAGARA